MTPLTRHDSNRASRGFSLLEVTSLIVILGLLAAVAFPIVDRMKENVQNRRYMDDIKRIRDAAAIYSTEHGSYPEVGETGGTPKGLEEFLGTFDWDRTTPFGGEWEWVRNRYGVVSAIAVRDPDVTQDHLQRFDAAQDDGNLHTGEFRFISDIRYAYVLVGEDDESEQSDSEPDPEPDPVPDEGAAAELGSEAENAS